jgi:hypothetical protein
MRKIWFAIGAVPAKHYITYRYLFDRTKPFKRYPIPGEGTGGKGTGGEGSGGKGTAP